MRFLGHPVHPMLSHFPVALLGTSLLWDAAGLFRHEPLWWSISFWDISLGVATAVLAAVAGFIDYASLGAESPASGPATSHMMLMLTSVSLYGASLAIRAGSAPPEGWHLPAALACEGLGLLLLGAGGWYGGDLVYRHRIGMR